MLHEMQLNICNIWLIDKQYIATDIHFEHDTRFLNFSNISCSDDQSYNNCFRNVMISLWLAYQYCTIVDLYYVETN